MKILVVDDDTVSRLVLAGVLATIPSAEIIQASDGQEAWKLLEEGLRPALCCSDIRMPILSGLELMARARKHLVLGALPFVLISSASDRETVDAAVRGGAAGYIVKPFNGAKIRSTVMRVLRESNVRHAENPLETLRRLKVDENGFSGLLSALKTDVDAERAAAPGRAEGGISRLQTACLTLGLWRAAELLKQVAGTTTPAMVSTILGEVACLVEEQAAQLAPGAPARAAKDETVQEKAHS